MNIANAKDLKQILKLCQAFGVTSIKIDNVEMRLEHHSAPGRALDDKRPVSAPLYTPEQIAMWSSAEYGEA